MSRQRPLKLALVGYGQAATLFFDAFAPEPEVQFRWVVGRLQEPADEFARQRNIPRATTHLAEALDDSSVDAVIVATPHALHYPQALAALQADKHVVVEVPMTMDAAQARQLVQEATARRLALSVPHISRYLDVNLAARRLIQAGAIGPVYQFVYRRLWLQRTVGHLFNRQRSWTDTVSWHHAAHPIDLVMWLLDEPIACVGAALRHDPQSGSEVDLSANFVTPSGTLVTMAMSYNAHQDYMDTLIVGDRAVLEITGFSQLKQAGVTVVAPEEALQVQGRAYRRYAAAVAAGLRAEAPIPISGAEILPVMDQLQTLHDKAARLAQTPHVKESVR
jgi:2-hydroxy-4-carboxymuconate semialdehyde hemiacetal dehydrogenase